LISILYPNEIPKLRVDRASFGKILKWVQKDSLVGPNISTSSQYRLKDFHQYIKKEIYRTDKRKDWFGLLDLYRNKLAHLGSGYMFILRIHGSGRYRNKGYGFMPKEWPFFSDIKSRPAT